jgi:hypothetical protein
MKRLMNFLLWSYTFCACVDPIFFETEEGLSLLVVEGSINTLSEPYRVRLSKTSKFNSGSNVYESFATINNAEVTINHVESGISTPLFLDGNGNYTTKDSTFVGQVGQSYFLEIILEDKVYRSQIETITPSPMITDVYYEYSKEDEEINIKLDADSPENSLLQWKWSGFYQLLTFLPDDPDTFDCCMRCYFPIIGSEIIIQDAELNSNEPISGKRVSTIQMDHPTGVIINIRQYSLSQNAYNYQKLLLTQRESRGGLFDPLPFEINGNIYCVNDPKERVLGYFKVSDIQEIDIGINRARYFDYTNYGYYLGDCRDFNEADTTRPAKWDLFF